MKLCAKPSCDNFSIPRGKFCDIHTTSKKRIKTSYSVENEEKDKENEERRKIIAEQKEEYETCYLADLEMIRKKEEDEIIKQVKEFEIQEKKKFFDNYVIKDDEECIQFQILLKNGVKLLKSFKTNEYIQILFDYIDNCIAYDKNEYIFVMYPKIKINRYDKCLLKDIFKQRKVSLFIEYI